LRIEDQKKNKLRIAAYSRSSQASIAAAAAAYSYSQQLQDKQPFCSSCF
jgi:mevalonate pyrophosphate decarboxylase